MECGLLVGDGPFRRLTVEEAEAYRGPGFVWLHLHGWDEEDFALLRRQDYIPDVAASALVATETRPRCDAIEFGAIVNLRGPGEHRGADSTHQHADQREVPHAVVQPGRLEPAEPHGHPRQELQGDQEQAHGVRPGC